MAMSDKALADGDVEGLARLPAAVRAQLAAGRRVYLNCDAGYNRAPTAAIAHLHEHHALLLEVACEAVKRRRSRVPYVGALRRRHPGT